MATTSARPRRVVDGVEHGLSAYTNYGCRCDICRTANTEHSREYRQRRFAGNPLCTMARCPHPQSPVHSNGLCYAHGNDAKSIRSTINGLSRRDLKKLIIKFGLDIPVYKAHTDQQIASAIIAALGYVKLAKMGAKRNRRT